MMRPRNNIVFSDGEKLLAKRLFAGLAVFFMSIAVFAVVGTVFFTARGMDVMESIVPLMLVGIFVAAVPAALTIWLSGRWIKGKNGEAAEKSAEVGDGEAAAETAQKPTKAASAGSNRTFKIAVAVLGGIFLLGLLVITVLLTMGPQALRTLINVLLGLALVGIPVVLFRFEWFRKITTWVVWLVFNLYLGKLALFVLVGGWWDSADLAKSPIGWTLAMVVAAIGFGCLFAVAEKRRERIVWLSSLAYFGGIVLPNLVANLSDWETLAWPAFAGVVAVLIAIERIRAVRWVDLIFALVAGVAAFGLTWLLGLVQPFGWRNQLGAVALAVVLVQLVYGLALRGELSLKD